MSGSHSGVEDAKNATATARVTASVKTIPLRWRGAAGIETAGVRGAARSFRNASQTSPIATARQATVTGRRYAVKVRNGIPDRIPMNAFCGLPTSVATLPTFAEIATATRYGIGFTRKARALRTTTGVTSNAIVSFRTTAEDRKSTRLNSSHANISYAVFCLKKKKARRRRRRRDAKQARNRSSRRQPRS